MARSWPARFQLARAQSVIMFTHNFVIFACPGSLMTLYGTPSAKENKIKSLGMTTHCDPRLEQTLSASLTTSLALGQYVSPISHFTVLNTPSDYSQRIPTAPHPVHFYTNPTLHRLDASGLDQHLNLHPTFQWRRSWGEVLVLRGYWCKRQEQKQRRAMICGFAP